MIHPVIRFSILFLLFFALISCSQSQKEKVVFSTVAPSMEMADMTASESAPPPPPPPSSNGTSYQPKLVKKGEMTISTDNIEATKSLIYKFVNQCQGYVTEEKLTKGYGWNVYEVSLNIAANHFDHFLQLVDTAKMNVTEKNFSVEDVTLKFIDDSTRLSNKKKLEQRYLALLAKAGEMKNILEIEEKLEEIRSDIEVREGQLNLLRKKVAFSTFTIKIVKETNPVSYEEQNKFSYKIKSALSAGWDGLKSFAVFLFLIWPAYFAILVLYPGMRWWIRRRKRK
jgi:hypothetical protein